MPTFKHDFKTHSPIIQTQRNHRPYWIVCITAVVATLFTLLIIPPHDAEALTKPPQALALTSIPALNTNIGAQSAQAIDSTLDATSPAPTMASVTPKPTGNWKTLKVKSGDNLSLMFKRHHFSAQELYKLLSSSKKTDALKDLRPGDAIELLITKDQQIAGLKYDIDEAQYLTLTQTESGYDAEIVQRQVDRRITHASATINNSLFLASQEAGLSDNLTMALAGIFGWDIDFALDIRNGDHFSVIYEEVYIDGNKIRDGKILAAEFNNRDKSYRAIRYTDAKNRTDYFSPDGKSMRKAFLRSPVGFSRISSRFNLNRKHPVLNRIRAHKGVDYAAARGTPIKATSDGKIVHLGRKGGYGKTIILQHGSTYTTLYAHLSGYKKGLRHGKRVKQGQVIGYVGSTGLATGPHLHYEFRLNGSHRNPLTVKLPDAAPLNKRYTADFQSAANPYLAQLDYIKRLDDDQKAQARLALNDQ